MELKAHVAQQQPQNTNAPGEIYRYMEEWANIPATMFKPG